VRVESDSWCVSFFAIITVITEAFVSASHLLSPIRTKDTIKHPKYACLTGSSNATQSRHPRSLSRRTLPNHGQSTMP